MQYLSIVDQHIPARTSFNKPPLKLEGINKGEVHSLMMVIVWMTAGIIGVWALAFRQYKFAIWLHFFCMSIVNIITWVSGFLMITEYGFTNSGVTAPTGPFHIWWGITILILTVLQWVSGIIVWILQKTAKTDPLFLSRLKLVHRIFGLIIILFVLVQILAATRENNTNIFTSVFIIDIFSIVSYLFYRFFRRKIIGSSASLLNNKLENKFLTTHQLLAKTKGEYFIFADKVYDLRKVRWNHPGGQDFIKNIKGREVDRYIYGSQALELYQVQPNHHHNAESMKLAGQPIGYLISQNPYESMKANNEVSLNHLIQPSKSKYMYISYLSSMWEVKTFVFKGYTDLSQLGKYFALTIGDKVTRLYSVVNFLNKNNIQLMSMITGVSLHEQKKVSVCRNSPNIDSQAEKVLGVTSQKNTIPLLMKKYHKGQLTTQFFDPDFIGSIRLSKPLGRGLLLHELPQGEVIYFAGGTGLNPLCDTIDLLFKQFLIQKKDIRSQSILYQNPILKSSPILKRLRLTLYYGTRNAEQMMQLTAHQLNELGLNNKMNTYICFSNFNISKVDTNNNKANDNMNKVDTKNNKTSENINKVDTKNNKAETWLSKYSGLKRLQNRFENQVPQLRQRLNKISQIYVCGPKTMNMTLVKAFQINNIPDFKYRIL